MCRCTFLAGCDGAHSTVRDVVGAAFAGGAYEHLFYVADVTARGPAIDDGVHVDLDAADLLAVFDMKGTGHARLVGTIRADAAERRANEPMTFEDVARRPIEQLGLEIDRVNWFSTYHVNHRVASRFRAGRAFLLGDAAHVHSPVGAQGMNTGIGDAVNLGWKLAMATRDGADAGLLDTYELERMAFARTLVTTTDRAFEIATKSGRLAAFVRTTVFPTLVSMVFRSRAARRYLFRTVSQLGIDYRESPLSVGRAGAVRGGDRLPWTGAVEGCDNFTALSSLRWQAHVYGFSVPNDLRYACAEAGLALYQFSWRPSMARSGLERDALYVVRPDGYVAFVDPGRDADRLRSYFTRWGIRGGWPCSPSPDSPRSGMKTSTPPAA